MTDNNKHQNKTEALNEEAKGKELSMEELEQVTGGSGYITNNLELPEVKPAPI